MKQNYLTGAVNESIVFNLNCRRDCERLVKINVNKGIGVDACNVISDIGVLASEDHSLFLGEYQAVVLCAVNRIFLINGNAFKTAKAVECIVVDRRCA